MDGFLALRGCKTSPMFISFEVLKCCLICYCDFKMTVDGCLVMTVNHHHYRFTSPHLCSLESSPKIHHFTTLDLWYQLHRSLNVHKPLVPPIQRTGLHGAHIFYYSFLLKAWSKILLLDALPFVSQCLPACLST